MYSPKLKSGTIFVLRPGYLDAKKDSDPCYATTGGSTLVYRRISLANYPSSNDFFDPLPEIKAGTIGIVVRPIGVPQSMWLNESMSRDPEVWEKYTVYEAVLDKELVQVFSHDMEVLKTNSKK